ncbi:sarcosine oxidase subunit alpha family protein [Rhodospirillales bacterium]|nr:sarcosine oxidase subunit alpha family protein [Rhodospirillales bacterium]
MSARRLSHGGRIDRAKTISFDWEGRKLTGYPGDTLASALMAGGQRVIGRSFKYHRPRGIMSAGVEESGAIVTLGDGAWRDPNVKATTQELYDGLVARGQHAWPNLHFDMGGVANFFSRFLPAGFYYKTFMGMPPFEWGSGTGWWMRYEKLIRRAAGMGTASRAPDPDAYEHAHAFCDLLVVGSGPAGLSAALVAAQSGLEVILVEQDFEFGGDLLNQANPESETKRIELLSAIHTAGVRTMSRTTAFGLYENSVAGLVERVTDHLANPADYLPRQRFWTVRSKQTVLATGALERLIAFGNNDRPGIMSANAGRTYLNRYGVLPGENIIVVTNNDSPYQPALELAKAGATVHLIDARTTTPELEKGCGVSVKSESIPIKAHGSKGIRGLESTASEGIQSCDLLLVSGGWSPVVHLLSHRGIKLVWDAQIACFLPGDTDAPIHVAGSAAGIWGSKDCGASGQVAAAKALGQLGHDIKLPTGKISRGSGWDLPIKPLYEIKVPGRKLQSFVDLQHDVTSEDVRLAHREGFQSVEHLKRFTTLGMATDQGKMGNIIGMALMAEALGKNIHDMGTTTFRPPYTPVSLGALGGRHVDSNFRPIRRTPLHDWNLSNGAIMTLAGLWDRPWYFPREGETIEDAYIREATVARKSVGLCDITSLGKIAVQGPDTAEFLNRIYTNPFAKLSIGKARYGIMLRDDGMVMDDGTCWRLTETDYFMTTTTAHAATVMVWLEELLQVRWPDLKVHVTSVSDQWAGCTVAGPNSRAVLEACVTDPTLISNETCPFMGVIETTLTGAIPSRIARISFSGELAFEVYVPSDYGPSMMDLLFNASKPLDGCLYGLEALGTLRIEKGHVTGAELDGRVTIEDAGLGKMASKQKSYIGDVLRKRPVMLDKNRARLVGIFPKDRTQRFNAGTILCKPGAISGFGEGWITGATYSPALGHWIGIGFISGGFESWVGQTVVVADPVRDQNINVEIVLPQMFDPAGKRSHD